MSRKKTFIENLDTVEITKLVDGKKHGKSDAFRTRCQAILLSNKRYTVSEISDILSVSVGAIFKWFSAWKKSGIEGLKTKPGQGRKPTLCTDNSDHVEGVKKAAKKAVEDGENLLLKIQQELELEEPLTKKMLSLFLTKLTGSGNAAEEV